MSMQALNQLVARSIIDPTIVERFSTGDVGEILADLDFTSELRSKLANLSAHTWAEFAVMAYRLVKVAEPVRKAIELPSPAEGLFPEKVQRSKEQVA
jgi:hypothetical protein